MSKTQLIVFVVWDRSAPGASFIRNELFCVYGPGAGFCLKPSIGVYGPGPFGSGSLFCLERNIVLAVRDRLAPGAGFCLKPSISVYGPAPFGSGSRDLFKTKY